MFNLEDRTFERVPKLMPFDIVKKALQKIEIYALNHGLEQFSIALHGGEPTLWPLECFKGLVRESRRIQQNGVNIDISMQTNGLRKIDRNLLDIFCSANVRLGISIDGPQAYHDKFRVRHDGSGSYEHIMQNINSLFDDGYGDLVAGFLTVANPAIPPEEFLEWIKSLPIQKVDVLWPIEFNLGAPPWEPGQQEEYIRKPYYGEWFSHLFELWWQEDDPSIYIRLFFNIIQLYLGSKTHIDSIVNDTLDMFVINTDGRIEYPDYLRASADGVTNSGHNIKDSDLDTIAKEAVFKKLFTLKEYLPSECIGCPHENICGGGFLPGRTSQKQLLSTEKSILCYDHFIFFSTIKRILERSVSRAE